MSKQYLISTDTLKTVAQGALGAMTFGAYQQYNTNKIMELNNEKQDLQQKYFMDKMEAQHNKEMAVLKEEIANIKNRGWFW